MDCAKDYSSFVHSLLIGFLFLITMLAVIATPIKVSSTTINHNTINEKGRFAETTVQPHSSNPTKTGISQPLQKMEARPVQYKKRLSRKRLKKLYFLVQLANQQRNSRTSL